MPAFQKRSVVATAIRNGDHSRYGLNFPYFVCVLSTIMPITGSFRASKILATKMIVPAILPAFGTPFNTHSVKNTSANIEYRLYIIERPKVAVVKHAYSDFLTCFSITFSSR